MDAQQLYSLIDEKYKIRKKYKPKEIVFQEGEECSSISFVISGSIKTESFSFDKQNIIAVLKKNEIFGNTLIFSSNPYYLGDIVALESTVVVHISKYYLLELLKNQTFLQEFLKILSNDRINDKIKLKMISMKSIEDRLNYLFLLNDGIVEFKSITNLAEILIVSREALSRLISRLIKENKIKKINHFLKKI